MVTLGQAAKLTSLSKTSIMRAIKSGRLSATRRDDGSYAIDPSELSRVYPVTPETGTAAGAPVHHAPPAGNARDPESDPLVAALMAAKDAEVRALRELLAEAKRREDDLRQERDRWAAQAERLALPAPARSRWWWRRSA